MPNPQAQERAALVALAKRATNGWGCYARTNREHDEIARLHQEIDKLAGASTGAGEGQPWPATCCCPICLCRFDPLSEQPAPAAVPIREQARCHCGGYTFSCCTCGSTVSAPAAVLPEPGDVEALALALRPFADVANRYGWDDDPQWNQDAPCGWHTLGDYARAAKALAALRRRSPGTTPDAPEGA